VALRGECCKNTSFPQTGQLDLLQLYVQDRFCAPATLVNTYAHGQARPFGKITCLNYRARRFLLAKHVKRPDVESEPIPESWA